MNEKCETILKVSNNYFFFRKFMFVNYPPYEVDDDEEMFGSEAVALPESRKIDPMDALLLDMDPSEIMNMRPKDIAMRLGMNKTGATSMKNLNATMEACKSRRKMADSDKEEEDADRKIEREIEDLKATRMEDRVRDSAFERGVSERGVEDRSRKYGRADSQELSDEDEFKSFSNSEDEEFHDEEIQRGIEKRARERQQTQSRSSLSGSSEGSFARRMASNRIEENKYKKAPSRAGSKAGSMLGSKYDKVDQSGKPTKYSGKYEESDEEDEEEDYKPKKFVNKYLVEDDEEEVKERYVPTGAYSMN